MPLYRLEAGFDMEGMDARIVGLMSAPNPEKALEAGRQHLMLKHFGLLWGPIEVTTVQQRKAAMYAMEKQMEDIRAKINALTEKLTAIQHNYDLSKAQGMRV